MYKCMRLLQLLLEESKLHDTCRAKNDTAAVAQSGKLLDAAAAEGVQAP